MGLSGSHCIGSHCIYEEPMVWAFVLLVSRLDLTLNQKSTRGQEDPDRVFWWVGRVQRQAGKKQMCELF